MNDSSPASSRGFHAMSRNVSQRWKRFIQTAPGRRFQEYFERRRQARPGATWQYFLIGIGILIMAVGVLLLALPGPGMIVIIVGAIILARESLAAARILDWSELRLRSLISRCTRWWRLASPSQRAMLLIAALALLGAFSVGSYQLLVSP